MEFDLSEEQLEYREAVIAFAGKRLGGDSAESMRTFDRARWEACAELGIQGLPIAPEYGGGGADILTTTVAMEALGYGCSDHGLLFSIHAHLWSVMMPIVEFGTEAQKQEWLPPLADGRWVGAHGMSEPGSGSDAFSLRTRAERAGDEYVLNGTKTFVTNAPVSDLVLVFANVAPEKGMWGVTAFGLPRDTPGMSVGQPFQKMGLNASPMSEVVLEDCRVPVSSRIGAEGQGAAIFNHSMKWERSLILASTVGAMAREVERSVEYARERKQFGKRIGDFQLVASRLADMKLRAEVSRLLLYRAAHLFDRGQDNAMEAALAKLYISEAAVDSGLDAVRVRGGYGYMAEYGVEESLRDAIGGTLYSGTSDIQRLLVARGLGFAP